MKPACIFLTISLLCLAHPTQSQDWRLYTASDAVTNFVRYQNDIWTISGSGLSRINLQTNEITTWNTVNSDLPDYDCSTMAFDSTGVLWMGTSDITNREGKATSKLIRFNGSDFETISIINGYSIRHISGIETTPDGKIWIFATTDKNYLYQYDQGQFLPVPLPSSDFTYGTTSSNFGVDANSHVWTILLNTTTDQSIAGEYDGSQWILHDVSAFGLEPETKDIWAHDLLGNVYLLHREPISPTQLLQYNGLQWNEIILASVDTGAYVDHPLFVDSENHLWLSQDDNSIRKYNGTTWTEFNPDAFGLSNGNPDKFYIDDLGHWWMMYDQDDVFWSIRNLFSYDGTTTQKINLSNSTIPSNNVESIIVDELNNKWFASLRSLVQFDGGQWTSFHVTSEDIYPWPHGSNKAGGVWVSSLISHISQFDGVTFSNIFLKDKNGAPLDVILPKKVDPLGRFLQAPDNSYIHVYDHGQSIFFDSIFYDSSSGEFHPEYISDVDADSSGQIYVLGKNLHRLEADSSWTNIPLWASDANGSKIYIGPEKKIWVLDPTSLPYEFKYWIYDGIQWNEVESNFLFGWSPKWDQHGNPWFLHETGLCKYENNTWYCLNRTNSPLIPGRISDFTIDEYNNVWVTQVNGGLIVFNENSIQNIDSYESPLLSGHVYRDLNQNGIKDDSDTPLAFHRALLLPQNTIAYSNSSGLYRMAASSGNHEVKYLPQPNWHIDNSPDSYNVTVDAASITGLDFNLVPDHEIVDLNLFLNEGYPRCERESSYWLSFNNTGTRSESVEVVFVKDSKTDLINSTPPPFTISGDTLKWYFSDLIPFGSDQIRIDLHIPGPPDTSMLFSGFINHLSNNDYVLVDSFSLTQEIRCSFDPNDKIARTVRTAGEGKSYLEDPLQYTIRFQNTGNDTAFTVIVRDTLDADLDLNTLEIIGASHPYEAFLKQDRTLEFRFANILLPDSTSNEMESHGFVSYSIKAKADLASPAIIENTAHIYFDFNTAVQTNTAINELVEFGTGVYNEAKLITLVKAYPNPTSDEIIIQAISTDVGSINYVLMSMQGQELQRGKLEQQESKRISLAKLPSGIYMLKATTGLTYQTLLMVKD